MPKGLLGLGEMLDEYISLKEQRVVLDQEKRRVDMALHGMQEVLRAYHSAGPASLPPSPSLLPPQFVATPVTPILPALYASTSGSPPGKRPPAPNLTIPQLLVFSPQCHAPVCCFSPTRGEKKTAIRYMDPKCLRLRDRPISGPLVDHHADESAGRIHNRHNQCSQMKPSLLSLVESHIMPSSH